jgi:hypothetical protein
MNWPGPVATSLAKGATAASREILPGYFPTKPLYPQVKALREILGFQDASIQLSALSLEILEETALASPQGPDSYLADAFRRHRIPSGLHGVAAARDLANRSYIVHTYHTADWFFRELGRAYRQFAEIPEDSWRAQDRDGSNLDGLSQLIQNLPPASRDWLNGTPETSLIHYYRLVRHSIIHSSRDTLARAERAYQHLIGDFSEHFTKCYTDLVAPNAPSRLHFHDFRLFTRSLKFYANRVNDACDLTLPRIAKALFRDTDSRRRILLRRSSVVQVANAIRNRVREQHNLEKEQVRAVAEQIFQMLDGVPTFRERKRASSLARKSRGTRRS